MRRPSEQHRLFASLYFLQRLWEPLGLTRHRRAVGRGVVGPALEVGVGTGYSLPYYATPPVAACDPNLAMVRSARRRARRLGHKTSFVVARGEALPFADDAFATVVTQAVLCSVTSPERVAGEVARVLRDDGHWRFVEHALSSRPSVARIQRMLAPVWRRLFAGCHLDREPTAGLGAAGLHEERVRRCSAGTVVRATYGASAHAHQPPAGSRP